ncbi:methyltransferase domain-containing protein [Nostoc sp. CHAB 5784]|uniref:class I SAM-dependent methyltransferase n=1 Tax=Nostoc mirabile TaxID=2907820 RepID=UPI001E46DCB0|nr:methyltransferase domain-containing protein [Nostoc mirabile]MCC5666556.1 methyltransferase domain-containing protein [Nostoc mirabile CHAB5784]
MINVHTRYWLKNDFYHVTTTVVNLLLARNPNKIKPKARFLNLGCGRKGIQTEDWLNCDGFLQPSVDYVFDITGKMPLKDARFEGIFSEHFFEHLIPDHTKIFLSECLRVLKPGGILRLSVPDGELYLDRYFNDHEWMMQRRPEVKPRTRMAIVNEVFRQGFQHQYCYDFETIKVVLEESGFKDVRRVDFQTSSIPELLIDQESRKFESLYVEATKP